jgi:hypothetical protein
VFRHLTVRGGSAAVLWGYRPAVTLRRWTITKPEGQSWTLTGTIDRVDAFMVRQRPLLFTAPRAQGFWAWGVESITGGPHTLVATLGPPEQ